MRRVPGCRTHSYATSVQKPEVEPRFVGSTAVLTSPIGLNDCLGLCAVGNGSSQRIMKAVRLAVKAYEYLNIRNLSFIDDENLAHILT